jgi:tetratricopeptide (TPR) repeat protein
MRRWLLIVLLSCVGAWAQSSSGSSGSAPPSGSPPTSAPAASSAPSSNSAGSSSATSSGAAPANAQAPDAPSSSTPSSSSSSADKAAADKSTNTRSSHLEPPRSDRVNADALEDGESSSKDTQIDLSPPAEDLKTHPKTDVLMDEGSSGSGAANEIHPWDPHRAAKDIEVGDFYFKRKNYVAAADRYREALLYKENDAVATFRLAECLEKMEQPAEAQKEYQNYLKILPNGPESEKAHKAIDRLNGSAASAKPGK